MPRFRLIVLLGFLGAAVAVGCGGSRADTTSTAGAEVVFGRGSVPVTVPETFPIPGEAVVGATLVDARRGLTEMILTLPADTPAVVDYYEQNLPSNGYTIEGSDGSETDWRINFSDPVVDGVLSVQTVGNGIAAATVQFTER